MLWLTYRRAKLAPEGVQSARADRGQRGRAPYSLNYKKFLIIIFFVVVPNLTSERGLYSLSMIISLLVSIMANVISYYICKWLDRYFNDDDRLKE